MDINEKKEREQVNTSDLLSKRIRNESYAIKVSVIIVHVHHERIRISWLFFYAFSWILLPRSGKNRRIWEASEGYCVGSLFLE